MLSNICVIRPSLLKFTFLICLEGGGFRVFSTRFVDPGAVVLQPYLPGGILPSQKNAPGVMLIAGIELTDTLSVLNSSITIFVSS